MIGAALFSDQQKNLDFEAISYAAMDGHDYFDASCNVNVDSIEVFFRADDPMLIAYVDALLAFEVAQETTGRAFVGYFSLRFTSNTSALIGPEQFAETCVIEIAGLQDVTGVNELIDFAIMLALDPNFGGILHWGQRNLSSMQEIQARFGDTPSDPTGALARWRRALSRVTGNGRLAGFSNAFSRQTGLEIVTPQVTALAAPATAVHGDSIPIRWDCRDNPPTVRVDIRIDSPSGVVTNAGSLPAEGQFAHTVAESGQHHITATATLVVNGETRTAQQDRWILVS